MKWDYADRYAQLAPGQIELVEALVKIAEQLERLNKSLRESTGREREVKNGEKS
jgi:hypothetical protein